MNMKDNFTLDRHPIMGFRGQQITWCEGPHHIRFRLVFFFQKKERVGQLSKNIPNNCLKGWNQKLQLSFKKPRFFSPQADPKISLPGWPSGWLGIVGPCQLPDGPRERRPGWTRLPQNTSAAAPFFFFCNAGAKAFFWNLWKREKNLNLRTEA